MRVLSVLRSYLLEAQGAPPVATGSVGERMRGVRGHGRYQGEEVLVEIVTGRVSGTMSRRALKLLFEWLEMHEEELRANWQRARERKPLEAIAPLP